MINGAAQMDGAKYWYSVADGPMPQTREHIVLARQSVCLGLLFSSIKQIKSTTGIDELVELEVRELLREYEYPGDGHTSNFAVPSRQWSVVVSLIVNTANPFLI